MDFIVEATPDRVQGGSPYKFKVDLRDTSHKVRDFRGSDQIEEMTPVFACYRIESTGFQRPLRINNVGCSRVEIKSNSHALIGLDRQRPCVDSFVKIRCGVLSLEDDEIGAKLSLISALQPSSRIIVVLHQREQRTVQLLSLLIPVVFVVRFVGNGELMQGEDMKAGNALVAIDCDFDVGRLGDLLNGKVVANSARSIPDKMMDAAQRRSIGDDIVEEVIDRLAEGTGRTQIGRKLFVQASSGTSEFLDHAIFYHVSIVVCLGTPHVVLVLPFDSLELGTHVRTCSDGSNGLGESARLVGVGQEALPDGEFALLLALPLELCGASEI